MTFVVLQENCFPLCFSSVFCYELLSTHLAIRDYFIDGTLYGPLHSKSAVDSYLGAVEDAKAQVSSRFYFFSFLILRLWYRNWFPSNQNRWKFTASFRNHCLVRNHKTRITAKYIMLVDFQSLSIIIYDKLMN